MSSLTTSSIVFAFVFGGAMLGMFLRAVVPQHYLSDESKDVVKMGMGLVATMSALVLGLLVSSAKNSFDTLGNEMTRVSSQVILLDRSLALYGPQTREARDLLRNTIAGVVGRINSRKPILPTQVKASSHEVDGLYEMIQGLSPSDDRQRSIQARALALLISLQETRWLMFEQESTSISMPMLIILLTWLFTLFVSFGIFAPANAAAVTALFLSALSVSGAILLILEMYAPYEGIIKVSTAPLIAALTQLGN